MRSGRLDEAALTSQPESGVHRLLDASFGFGVWAIHLLVVYVLTAVACQLGLGSRDPRLQSGVVVTLIAITLVAAAVVVLHAVARYRQQKGMQERGFLARLAVGQDAIAALAIFWQIIPLTMVPPCR
jgi:hypothetical protein